MDSEAIREYCEFGPHRVYLLLAIARSKENDDIQATDQPTIRKVVENSDEIEDKLEQLEHATKRFPQDYRLYLTINARDITQAFFMFRQEMEQWMKNIAFGNKNSMRNLKRIDHLWKSYLHKQGARDDKLFLFDMDDASESDASELEDLLSNETAVITTMETPNGYHIITEPFNYTEFESEYEYELKKDGMTFLGYLNNDN